jgi:hypothetical protein
MGHNLSTERRRTALLRLPLGDFATWHMMVKCQRCPDNRYLPLAVLIARYGDTPVLREVVARLRCRFPSCRARPAAVVMFSRLASETGAGEMIEVALVGPGAF